MHHSAAALSAPTSLHLSGSYLIKCNQNHLHQLTSLGASKKGVKEKKAYLFVAQFIHHSKLLVFNLAVGTIKVDRNVLPYRQILPNNIDLIALVKIKKPKKLFPRIRKTTKIVRKY